MPESGLLEPHAPPAPAAQREAPAAAQRDFRRLAVARARLAVRAEQAWGAWPLRAAVLPIHRECEVPAALDASRASDRSPEPAGDLFGRPSGAKPAHGESGESAFADPPPARPRRIELLRLLDETEVVACAKCPLCHGRTRSVFGEGDPEAQVMFIGEGPGENEDLTGRPFVGRAGELLDKMIAGMGLRREAVYIANVVKCRPPNNRAPTALEVSACTPYLHRQIELIRPRVIVTLGLPAARHLLRSTESMGRLRGRWNAWRGIRVMPTYHPAYLLRSYTPENRRAVWDDLRCVMAELGLKAPATTRER